MKRAPGMRESRAFTLVEILVSLSVISILAVLIMPSLEAARLRALNSACQHNLRGIGSAMQQYATDNNEWFPPHWGARDPATTLSWYGFLAPYLAGWNGNISQPMSSIFQCPASEQSIRGKTTYISTGPNTVGQSYGYNYYLLTQNAANQPVKKSIAVRSLSKLVLVADIPPVGSSLHVANLPSSMSSFRLYPGGTAISSRHPLGTANVLFADGHVENVNAQRFVTAGQDFSVQNWDPR